ncbi:MAG: hypothetical protein ACI4SS_01620 [Clostridia bacterium]
MIAIILCAALILFPDAALKGAGLGLEICLQVVIPSLLPFMVVSSIAVESGWGERLGKVFSIVLKPLFGMDKAVSMCFVTGLIGGYPCGARTVAQCVENGSMSKSAGEKALAFCNNSGPLFIMGTAGAAVYGSAKIGLALYLCHIFGALVSAAVFSGGTASAYSPRKAPKASLGVLAGKAAQGSGAAALSVCSLIITFSSVIEALKIYRLPLLVGLLEVARGVKELGRFGATALPLAAAYLSWGGLSVHFQTEAVCGGLSKKYYYVGKIISSVSAGAAMFLCIKFFGKYIL